LQTQGLYPEARIDEDTVLGPKPDVLTDQKKKSAGDNFGDGGVSSAEPIAPNLISSNVLK
jgi:hypothetical protein